MSAMLGSYIEVVIPKAKLMLGPVQEAITEIIKAAGGATFTDGRGAYIRKDTGELEMEDVTTLRVDYRDRLSLTMDYAAYGVQRTTNRLVQELLDSGEESVMRRRYYARTRDYNSGLIFR